MRALLARALSDPRAVLELRAPVIAAVATLTLVVLANRYSRRYDRNLVDDAMISVRYAENLALGNGLVFNPGERVEGYTNFLWTVVMAPLHWLARLFDVEVGRLVIQANLASAVIAMMLTYAVGRRLWESHVLATLAALGILALDNAFACWAVFGLETHFLAVWLLAALWAASSDHPRRGIVTGGCLALAQMTRPDAALFSVALIGSELVEIAVSAIRRSRRAEVPALARQVAGLLLALGIAYGAYFLWRYGYYGDLFPNTYYVKLGGEIDAWERGRAYVREFFEQRDWWLVPAAGALFAIHRKIPRALVFYLPAHFFYVAYAGGDFFSGHRLLVPQLPLLALCIGQTIAIGWQVLTLPRVERALVRWAHPPALFAGAAAVVVLFASWRIYRLGLKHGPFELEVKAWGHDLSGNRQFFRWLRDHKPPGATVATGLIGHTAFYGDLPVYDIFGIVNPEIARRPVKDFGKGKAGHEKKATLADVLAAKPTFIVGGYVHADYWHLGYFWFDEVPAGFAKRGIWQRDALAETGDYLEHTRIDFESSPPGTTFEGVAFELGLSRRAGRGQIYPRGVVGAFLNSSHPVHGDAAKGRFRSAPFALEGDLLVLRVGGGRDAEKLRVALVVDGREVAHATGSDGTEVGRRTFSIAEHRGKLGVLDVKDDADWTMGHLVVDEVVQWKKR